MAVGGKFQTHPVADCSERKAGLVRERTSVPDAPVEVCSDDNHDLPPKPSDVPDAPSDGLQ